MFYSTLMVAVAFAKRHQLCVFCVTLLFCAAKSINFCAFRDFCVKYRSSRRGCPGRYPAEAEGRARGKPSLEIPVVHLRLRSPESPHRVGFSSVSRANLSLLSHPQRYKFYIQREKKYRCWELRVES